MDNNWISQDQSKNGDFCIMASVTDDAWPMIGDARWHRRPKDRGHQHSVVIRLRSKIESDIWLIESEQIEMLQNLIYNLFQSVFHLKK